MGIDLIGSGDKTVAVVEVGDESVTDEEIVRRIIGSNKNVRSVVKRRFGAEERYRTRETKVIWGDKDTEVLHREYGYALKADPQKVYFSPRESTMRRYVSGQVGENEKVLVMFAGVGPYPISIAKTQPKVKEIVSVEWNPDAVKYMKENVRLNKVSHLVTPVEGDVRSVCGEFDRDFDRVIMPMINAGDYIDLAVRCTRKGGMIQIYLVSNKENFDDSRSFVAEKLKSLGESYEIKGVRKIGMFAPGKWKILMEIKLK